MMTPYYEVDGITIFHGDAREILPTLSMASVDLVLADPNYGETSLNWDIPVKGWLDLVRPLLKPSGSLWCFGSLAFFMDHAADFAGWQKAQELVWEKQNGTIFHADRFRRVHEFLAHFYPRGVRWSDLYKLPQYTLDATKHVTRRKGRPAHTGQIERGWYVSDDGGPRLMRSVLQIRSCHGYAIHPTQKPEGIVRPAMRYSCPPGGLVLDPFMGSGTTLAVARQEGRSAIGIELQEQYCAAAVQRLAQSVLPMRVA